MIRDYRKPVKRVGLIIKLTIMKISLVICILLFIASIGLKSNAQGFYDQEKMNSPQEFRNNGYNRVGVALRHHGQKVCTCPGGCTCPNCKCPVGLCVCIDLRPVSLGDNDQLIQSQIAELYGTAWVKISGGQLHVIFETPNDENGIMTIDTSPTVDATDSPKFGVTSAFTIANGEYTLVKAKYTYGEIVLNISND